MATLQHDDTDVIDLLDDLREVSGVLGCGYPTVPVARAEDAPVQDLAVLAATLDGYEDYGS